MVEKEKGTGKRYRIYFTSPVSVTWAAGESVGMADRHSLARPIQRHGKAEK
jgi:hypothetical protein